jgi:hypothetical protein
MAGPRVGGGGPQDTIKTMNQTIGQMMTFIQQNKQIQEMEASRRQQRWVADFAATPEQATLNATNRNPGYMFGLKEFYGLDDKAAELYASSVAKSALLPQQQGTLFSMQAWEKLKEGDTSFVFAIGEAFEGTGLDLPKITDRLDKGFAPTAPIGVTGGAPPVTTTTPQEEPEIPPGDTTVVAEEILNVPREGVTTSFQEAKEKQLADLETSSEAIKDKLAPEQIEEYEKFQESERQRILKIAEERIEGQSLIEAFERGRQPGEAPPEVEQKAQDLKMAPSSLDEAIKGENLFRIQERKRQELDQVIDNLETELRAIPPEGRSNPIYLKGVNDLKEFKVERDNISLRNQVGGRVSSFIRTGAKMSKFAVGKQIDTSTEKYVREMEVIEVQAMEALKRENIIPGREAAYLENKVRGTMGDRQARDIITLLEKTPGLQLNTENIARGAAREQGPLTRPEIAKGTGALLSLTREAISDRELKNIRDNLSEISPAVLGEYFPAIFNRQLQLNDQEIRVSQQRINNKIANTQQYQVMMQAYYQSVKDQMAANDPKAAIAFELTMVTLDAIVKDIDWNKPDEARKAWAKALETVGIAGAGVAIGQDVFSALGLKFKDLVIKPGFIRGLLGEGSIILKTLDISSDGPTGFVQDQGPGVFGANAFLDEQGF